MLLNAQPLNTVPLNGGAGGSSLIPVGFFNNAIVDGSYITGANAFDWTDGSHVIGQLNYILHYDNATDGSFVLGALSSLFAHIMSADAAQVGRVPTDKTRAWSNAFPVLNLETTGYIPHVRVTSEDGLTVYTEGVDYVLEFI